MHRDANKTVLKLIECISKGIDASVLFQVCLFAMKEIV